MLSALRPGGHSGWGRMCRLHVKSELVTWQIRQVPRMQRPHPSKEVRATDLIPGQQYWSIPLPQHTSLDEMRGTFIEYYTNSVGIPMVRFRPAYIRVAAGGMQPYGPGVRAQVPEVPEVPEPSHGNDERFYPNGFVSRLWQPPVQEMRRYYKLARFTPAEIKELKRRVRARERREAQRGLMGSFPVGRRMGTWPLEKLPAVILGLIAAYL